MEDTYHVGLLILSLVIAVVASYAALNFASHASTHEGRAARIWLTAGAFALGGGIWSMHFIGKLAFSAPVVPDHDFPLTLISLLIGIVFSGLALWIACRTDHRQRAILIGGALLALGVCAMHYTGLEAMQSQRRAYDAGLIAASVIIALAASIMALHVAFSRRPRGARLFFRHVLAALVLGLAITGIHHAGMVATGFSAGSIDPAWSRATINSETLAYLIGFTMLGLLAAMLAGSILEANLSSKTSRMLRQVERINGDLTREIEARKRIESAMHLSQAQFRAAFEDAPIGMVLSDASNAWLRVNPALCRMLGYSEPELIARDYIGAVHPDDLATGRRALQDAVESGTTTFQVELRFLHRSGMPVPTRVSLSSILTTSPSGAMYVSQIEDISQYRRQHERIMRLNRMHALLSSVSSRIVRTRERQALFDQICEVAIQHGRFRFSWIGTIESDGHVIPISHCGMEDGYLSDIASSLVQRNPLPDDSSRLTARDNTILVVNDIANDPVMAQWRDAAIQRGYRAMVSLPLVVADRVVACFNLYASDVGFFDEEELQLLGELVDDISYALEFIARGEEMTFLAYYDPLTGTANRRLFLERLNERIRSARSAGRQLAVAMVDLDHFKSINDAWGQAAGDRMLLIVAERLGKFTRSTVQLARITGDRFALVLPDAEDTTALSRILQDEVLDQIAQPLTVFGQDLRISAKAGVAIFPIDGEEAEGLLRNAESALKHAKRRGEPLYYYTRQLSAAVRQRMEMENRLRHAIARNEFCLHYQPKLALPSGQTVGVEALVRWNSPDMGMVPPQQFIPLLEETGLIRDVGFWIIDEALRASREWSLIRGESTPRIAVNVSSMQLQQPDFVSRVRERLRGFTDGSHGLDMEVTESLMLGEVETSLAKLQELRSMGIRIAIDDFGTGYSSLTYLARLPVDALKIDRSFVVKMSESEANVSLVQTIITMAHSLGLIVIAEGVDSIEQLRLLRRLQCDQVQGFLFSRGVPFARLDAVVDALQLPGLGVLSVEENSRLQAQTQPAL